jgi:hypothetical protein
LNASTQPYQTQPKLALFRQGMNMSDSTNNSLSSSLFKAKYLKLDLKDTARKLSTV